MVETAKRKKPKSESAETYAKRLAWQTAANRAATAAHRDFGPIPKPVKPRRKSAAKKSLKKFCESYLKPTFSMPWSDDHVTVLEILQTSIINGGLFAVAMPRGSGKTSLTEAAALWAILYGFRKYVFLVGATELHAENLLASIRQELESNDKLLEDFPEVCLPIRKLEGVTTRRLLSEGHRVRMTISTKELQLPWIDGKPPGVASGSVVQVRGITGAIRGAKIKLPSGETIRPSLCVIDDPQTDESAKSPSQSQNREQIIAGAVLGLAGPGQKIAAVLPCTVIAQNDLADRMLDRELHPEWGGERIQFVKTFPKRTDLWEAYKDIRSDSLRETRTIEAATAFYAANRADMDAGAAVSWQSRFDVDEISAIQHAMNKRFSDEVAFWSELQNEPRQAKAAEVEIQTVDEIAARTNGADKLSAMVGTEYITGFIDVQQKALYYCLVGWRSDFTGGVLDYGTYPDQKRKYYALSDIGRTLKKEFPGAGLEGALTAGMTKLVSSLFSRSYYRENDNAEILPSLILIDANWKTSTVRDFCRRLRSTAVVPCHGRFVGASSRPISEYRRARGEKIGLHWKSSTIERMRHVLFDTNFYKTFVHERFGIAFGDGGALTMFGSDPKNHRMFAEHLTSEFRVRVESPQYGRVVDEWKTPPNRDNHFLDCLCGATVAASVMGATLEAGQPKRPTPKRKRRRRFT